jgi:exodeoxyribonuclease VII large subunit
MERFGHQIWVKGEIHGLKAHAKSGHMYFDLVEKPSSSSDAYIAKVSCAFFKGSFIKWQNSMKSLGIGRFELNSGLEIKLKASVDLFVKEGRYQLIVSEIDPSYTFGAIAKKRARTIEFLRRSGLMEKNKGLKLPDLPLNIGLITSEGSAAYNDFMSVILKSLYSFNITLIDAHMQGENTIHEVLRGIRTLQRHPRVDTIAIIRGGGAKTDLFSFDDLTICKAIAESTKPVITGIGHEIDVSVADMVAHTYCVTPTDVGRYYVSLADRLWEYLLQAGRSVSTFAGHLLNSIMEQVETLATHLEHLAARWTITERMGLKSLAYNLHRIVVSNLSSQEKALLRIASHLKNQTAHCIGNELRRLDKHYLGSRHGTNTILESYLRDLQILTSNLKQTSLAALNINADLLNQRELVVELMHPSQTLKRGYSITLNSMGSIVTDPAKVEMNESITTVVQKGKIKSTVYDKEPQ